MVKKLKTLYPQERITKKFYHLIEKKFSIEAPETGEATSLIPKFTPLVFL